MTARQEDVDALARRLTALERNLFSRTLAAIGTLDRLSVGPDDTIIVTVDRWPSSETIADLGAAVRGVTGHNRVLVLPAGIGISVAERAS